jgi:phosphotransferase system enzyme I (PtsP)
MGGRTLEALALIGIGIRRLSITPAAVGPIKAMVRSTIHSDVCAKMEELLNSPTENLREELTSWAIGQGIEIG